MDERMDQAGRRDHARQHVFRQSPRDKQHREAHHFIDTPFAGPM